MSTPRPFTLVAELTYRCPLSCGYCSNPTEGRLGAELDPATWVRVLRDAEGLGVVQVHFTGGEPLAYAGLPELVAAARRLDLYSQLVTSGVPVDRAGLERLRDAGLDAVQLSFQAADATASERIAGIDAFERKLVVARWVRELGLPLTVNVVLHSGNIDDIDELLALADRLGARRLELANARWLGWALANRDALLPSRAQIERARGRVATARRQRRMEIVFVLPDYHAGQPAACMEGWGQRYIVVAPDGLVLPCHAARALPGLRFEDVRATSLRDAWRSPGMEAYRGDAWMAEPCRSCERRRVDHGGCRCQAFLLTGDPNATDPACRLAPTHAAIEQAVARGGGSSRPGARRTLPVWAPARQRGPL